MIYVYQCMFIIIVYNHDYTTTMDWLTKDFRSSVAISRRKLLGETEMPP